MFFRAILLTSIALIAHGDNDDKVEPDDSNYLPPRVTIAIAVHPHNKLNILPYTLGGIEEQRYPKERISVHFFHSLYAPTVTNATRRNLNSATRSMLNEWKNYWSSSSTSSLQSDTYHSIKMHQDTQELDEEHGDSEYWTRQRYSRLMSIKQKALEIALEEWSDFLLITDADVVYTNENMLKYLLVDSGNSSISVFAPLIESMGTYSNFWAGVTSTGYYARTPEYLPILQREKVGWFTVAMIHSAIFIDLNNPSTHDLQFYPEKPDEPFDDIISFASSVHKLHMEFYVNNDHIWGFVPPPVSGPSSELTDQQLIDLQLEALIESPGFTIAKAIAPRVKSSFSFDSSFDSLGVDEVYIINLLRRPERHKRMVKTMDLLGIKATIWPATDGKTLTPEKLNQLGIRILPDYKDPYHKRPMTYGEIGCFLSHYSIWKHLAFSNYSRVIVFEDDVRFSENFKSKYNETISQVDWNAIDFLYLGRKAQGGEDELVISANLVKPKYSYWTIGYIITKTGARKLIDADPLPTLLPVDEYLPIMYDESPFAEWVKYFPRRNLNAASANPVLIAPTHFIGDQEYISDTEDSINVAFTRQNEKSRNLIGPDGKLHLLDEL